MTERGDGEDDHDPTIPIPARRTRPIVPNFTRRSGV
jgi:hypothetical protein